MFNFIIGPIVGVIIGIIGGLVFAFLLGIEDDGWKKFFMIVGGIGGVLGEIARFLPKERKRRK